MAANPLRGFLALGIFVGGGGLLLAFAQPPDSPEFVLSVCSAALGGFLVIGVAGLTRWLARHE